MKKIFFVCLSILISAVTLLAQNRGISGTVVDHNGQPLPGVGIMVKGTTIGVVSDIDGKFALAVPANSILEVSCVGFTTLSLPVGDATVFNIAMEEDVELLEGTVVVGYGTVKRTNFTGSVASYNVSDGPVSNVPKTSALDMLRGIAPGLAMSQSGVAGSSPSIQVRGQKSISGGSDPLIVLDGVIFKGQLNDIDPNSIESMSVMKDATSLASYGSQAANGVIMITSKKGKRGKPMINVKASLALVEQNYTPDLRTGAEYIELINARRGSADLTDVSWMTPLELANYKAGKETDWIDYVSQTGVQQDYSINVSGAGESMNYYVGAGYSDITNFIKGNRFIRETVTARLNADINKYISLGFNVNWANSQNDGVRPSYGRFFSPYGEPYMEDGVTLRRHSTGMADRGANPLWSVYDNHVEATSGGTAATLGGNLTIKIPWIKGLSYKITGNYSTRENSSRRFYHESYFVTPQDQEYTAEVFDQYLDQAYGTISTSKNVNWVLDNIITYDREIGDHYINGTLVYTMDSARREGYDVSGEGFAEIGNTTLGSYGLNNAKTQKVESISYTLHNDIGYLARLNYSWKNKYHLNASVRRDGSSVFGTGKKWGTFPAVGAAWTISDEPWMEDANWLDYLKLKLSWGKNGNQSLAPYESLSRLEMGMTGGITQYFGGKPVFGQIMTTLGNPDLGWETTTSWNGGFEMDFLKRRLHFEVDAYTSKTTDQIFNRTIPVMGSGITSQQATMGQVNNWGIEASLRANIVRSGDWDWTTTLNFTINRNKLVELYGDGKDDIVNNLFLGKSLGAYYGYVWDGIVQENDTEYMKMTGYGPGDIKYKDLNGDGKINPADDRQILGYNKENFRMSLVSNLRWKGLTLYAVFNGVFGGNGYGLAQNNNAYMCSTEEMDWLNTVDHPYWTPENKSNIYPKVWRPNGRTDFIALQSYGFVRLQDLNLSYTFSGNWLKKANIQNLQVFASGQNLFFIAPHWEYSDPEVRSFQSAQLRRTYTFGVNIRF